MAAVAPADRILSSSFYYFVIRVLRSVRCRISAFRFGCVTVLLADSFKGLGVLQGLWLDLRAFQLDWDVTGTGVCFVDFVYYCEIPAIGERF